MSEKPPNLRNTYTALTLIFIDLNSTFIVHLVYMARAIKITVRSAFSETAALFIKTFIII